jgi:DNA-binding transcriptional LysR family regulator
MRGAQSAVEIRQLRVFLAVCAHGSVSLAATQLGLAQSTASESLAALDRAVGTPTITRRRGVQQIALTDAGNALLPHARRVLHEIEVAHNSVANITRNGAARIGIIANESIVTHLLPAVLGELRSQWPNTRFAVTVADCTTIRTDIARGDCDIGLLLESATATHATQSSSHAVADDGAVGRPGLNSRVPLAIFSGPDHPLARSRARHVAGLDAIAQFPVLIASVAGEFQDMLPRYFGSENSECPQLRLIGSIDAVRRDVRSSSRALGVLPLHAIADDVESGRLRALRVKPAPPQLRLAALLPRTRVERHPSVGDLLQALREI